MTRALSLGSSLSAVAVSAVLAGCGGGTTSATTTNSTRNPPVTGTGTGASVGHTERERVGQHQSVAKPLTREEMAEYDANEGRCHDDGGAVRDVGTVNAYCAFPARSNDFHLIESSKAKELAGVEE